MIELFQGYLNNLNNANHFGVVTQIVNEAEAFTTDNQVLVAAVIGLRTAFNAEDAAFLKSGKDWNVERLKAADDRLDGIMVGIRAILSGHAALPDGFPLKQSAKEFLQMWKDFGFKVSDSYSGETSKVINMWQTVSARQADAEALGIYGYFSQANDQALLIQQLLSQRLDELAGRTVGELRDARQATDAAVKQLYLVLNSMQVLAPSAELTTLVRKLKAIEDYAKQYYIASGSSGSQGGGSGDGGGSQGGGDDDGGSGDGGGGGDDGGGGDTPTPTPDPTPDPDPSGGGGDDGGGDEPDQ